MVLRILTLTLFLCWAAFAQSQCFLVPSQVCLDDCGPLFYLQNDPDETTYEWSISCGTITNDSLANPHTVCFTSIGICTIQVIIQVPGETPDTCSETVEVLPHSFSPIMETVCAGDSVEINGSYYTEGTYSDTIFGGAVNGCDSILQITVTSLPPDIQTITYEGCEGDGYSVVVNSVTYNESNPTGQEVLDGSDGCDSIINIDLVFNPNVNGNEFYIGCTGDGYFVIVNGTTYNESNPAGTETLSSANGCDSVVTVNLIYFMSFLDTIVYNGCSGDSFSIMVGNSLYDENNPMGVDTLPGGCDTIVTTILNFDTLSASLTLTGNQLCASPSGMQYSWYQCDGTPLPDTTECITINGTGCVCVIIDSGGCIDTICQDFQVCELVCDIIAPSTSCLGDSVLITASTNGSLSVDMDWTITLDTFAGVMYNDTDSIWTAFNTPGCYAMELQVQDLGCITTCTDTICIGEKPLADLCCDEVACDTCISLTVFLFGNPPLTIAITDGNVIDTISGITNSQYDYMVCPPFDTSITYTLLWVQDDLGYCNGGIINATASVYLEERPTASIIVNGNTLCAEPSGLAYNWIDCQNMSNLSFDSCFVPAASGCYCVTVSTLLTDCIDTACVNFIISSTQQPADNKKFDITYDPGENAILIKGVDDHFGDLQIRLTDIQGRNINFEDKEFIDQDVMRIRLSKNTPSLMFVSVFTSGLMYTGKVVVIRE